MLYAGLYSCHLVSTGHSAQSVLDNPFREAVSPQTSSSDEFGELSLVTDHLEEDEGLRRVKAQQLEAHVKSELSEARKSRDPSYTKISLKALQDQIRRSPDLDASGRTRLDSQIASAIQSSARAEVTLKEQLSRTESVQSSQSASKRLLAETEQLLCHQRIVSFDQLLYR